MNTQKKNRDLETEEDVKDVVVRFYDQMLKDPIVGYIFTDVARIELEEHLPIIVNFWSDILFSQKQYNGNVLKKHLDLNQLINLTPGHFTRWLYLFNRAIDESYTGINANSMKERAESVAKTISARLTERKRGEMNLTL